MRFIRLTLAFPAKDSEDTIDVYPSKILRMLRMRADDGKDYTHVGYGYVTATGHEIADRVVESRELIKDLIGGRNKNDNQ